MIKSLRLLNFQSHKDSSLDFVDGVNIIVGNSDSGKTAIIRALRKLFFNRPLGDAMCSTWGGKTEIELFTDNAHIVYKKDKENEYVLGDTHFKAFSTDVPKEITDVLRIGDVNIQGQLDAPYLLSLSAGDVASHFNKVANLDKIDSSTQKVNSAIRELTADIKYKEAQDVKLTEDLKAFDYLPQFEKEVEELEELEKKSKELDASFTKLYQWTASYYEIRDRIEYFQKTLSLEKPVNDILKLIDERAEKDAEVVKLDRIVSQLRIVQNKIAEQSKLISLETPVLELLSLMEERKRLVERHAVLSTLLSQIKGIQVRIINGNAFILNKTKEFEKEMGSVCILCGQKLN